MIKHLLPLMLLALLCVSCGDDVAETDPPASNSALEAFWATSAPTGARPVGEIMKDSKSGDDVVVIGRVKDFNQGLAAFTLIDTTLKSCLDMGDDDHCPTPWDYCCVEPEEIAANTLSVEVHDASGRPFRESLKGFHDLDHLQTISVSGKVTRDDAGNVRIAAAALHRK